MVEFGEQMEWGGGVVKRENAMGRESEMGKKEGKRNKKS